MDYVTQQQLVDRFGERLLLQLTDRATPPAGEIDAAAVADRIRDAGAVIDGYLAGRYQLPLGDVPDLVRDLALSIAIYKLHPFAADPKIEADYNGALRTLRDIATGTIRLSVAGIEPTGSQASGVQYVDRERPFTPENLRGFI
jgi:phage gp36-like protein